MSVTINGTTGITTPDVTSDSYTGPLSVSSSAPDNSMTLDASGNLAVKGKVISTNDTTQTSGLQMYRDAGTGSCYLFDTTPAPYSGPLIFGTTNTERMRIDSSGNLLVGTMTNHITSKVFAYGTAGTGNVCLGTSTASSTNYPAIFNTSNTTQAGYIFCSGTTTSYATSSDYRLKQDIQPMTGALAKVAALKPCTYTWKADGSAGEGFIAHELAEVVPSCVTGEKDAVDAEGNPVYQGIDTSFLVSTLTAAIQEQQAIIESLTARVAALEGAQA